jgi:DNA-binding MarR family transcriptional regulator
MAKIDAAGTWSLNHRLLASVLASVAAGLATLGLEAKDMFLLAEVDAHPYPAELGAELLMPKATVAVTLKRLQATGFLRRELDTADLRRHHLTLTPAGRRAATKGLALLSDAFGARLDRLSAAQQKDFRALLEKLA